MLCCCHAVYAQVLIALIFGDKLQTDKLTFGLVVSPTFSTISNVDGDSKSGLGLGMYFDIKISENFFLHPEAIPKSSLGANGITPYPTGSDSLDALFADGSVQRKIRAISLPLLCRYRIKGLLFAELGPQIDWMLNAKDIYKAKINDNEMTYTTNIKDQFTRFDVGLAGGFDCKLKKDKGMGLGLRYFYGLTDVMKTGGTQKNRALYINIAIPVGTGKTNGQTTSLR
jgi:hypothetical protein